jgi:hypothetical protein
MILKYGDRGNEVVTLQRALKSEGLYGGLLNGMFDAATESAVVTLERNLELPIDGIADEGVFNALKLLDRDRPITLLVERPLSYMAKATILAAVSVFEGSYCSINADGEFEGKFDRPNRSPSGDAIPAFQRKAVAESNGLEFLPHPCSKYGDDPAHIGLSFGFIQFTQDGGSLGLLLSEMRESYPVLFDRVFGPSSSELLEVTNAKGAKVLVDDPESPTGKSRRSPRVQPVGGTDIWTGQWLDRFTWAGQDSRFQNVQASAAIRMYFDPMLRKVAKDIGVRSEKGLAILLDRCIQLGVTGCWNLVKPLLVDGSNLPCGEREFFDRLYAKVKGKPWSHRTRKLMDSNRISWYNLYTF